MTYLILASSFVGLTVEVNFANKWVINESGHIIFGEILHIVRYIIYYTDSGTCLNVSGPLRLLCDVTRFHIIWPTPSSVIKFTHVPQMLPKIRYILHDLYLLTYVSHHPSKIPLGVNILEWWLVGLVSEYLELAHHSSFHILLVSDKPNWRIERL